MAGIFISYRRTDTGGHAGRLFDRLQLWFDADALFYDLDGIEIGDNFPARLEAALNRASVILVIIGPDWLTSLNQRISQPGVDFVRREVELALARHGTEENVLVLPVLVGDATMPASHEFDSRLQARFSLLCALDAHVFQGKQSDWNHQFVRLRERISRIPGVQIPRFRPPEGTDQPFQVIEHLLSSHFQDPNSLLANLQKNLLTSGGAAIVARASLFGMGGVGKTQLALKYSHEYRDHYAGVWWFRAETATRLQIDARDCCKVVNAPIREGEEPSAALKRWLEYQDASWLLVYDNADGVATLRAHLPERGRHHVIITSRNPAWGGVAQPVELEVWSSEQGADFLAERLLGKTRIELGELASDLGGLPLALEQAASYLEETGATVADYRALIGRIDTEGLILGEGRAATGYERSVAATLSLAFGRLSPAAAQLLRLCAYAAPEPFPERFFREAARHLSPALAKAVADPITWDRVVRELRCYSLAERIGVPALDGESEQVAGRTEQALSLHRLTQQITRSQLAVPNEDCQAFETVLSVCCPQESELPAHWVRFASLTPHVTQLVRYATEGYLESFQLSWLLDRVASYLAAGPALYADSSRWFQCALDILSKDVGKSHPEVLRLMSNLAGTLFMQGDLVGARELQKQVLRTESRLFGEDHPITLAVKNNLATILTAQGDMAAARALLEQVLAVDRRVRGEEHPETLSVMNNLATTLRGQGDLAGARELQERVLAIASRVLGAKHPHTLICMNNLAETLREQDDLSGTRTIQEQLLVSRRQLLGEEHPDTLTTMNNLAGTLRELGDLDGALALHEQVLVSQRRVLGAEHPNNLKALNNMAETLRAQEKLASARSLYGQVLDAQCRVLGQEHPDTLTTLNGLAQTLWHMHEPIEALQMTRAVTEGFARILGSEHPYTVASRKRAEQMSETIDRASSKTSD